MVTNVLNPNKLSPTSFKHTNLLRAKHEKEGRKKERKEKDDHGNRD
jgi:hypothetical protein